MENNGIVLEMLSTIAGHSEIYFNDVSPSERQKLSNQISELLKQGHLVFLMQGDETRKVTGYDSGTNEWIVQATPKDLPKGVKRRQHMRFSGRGSRAMGVPRVAGG